MTALIVFLFLAGFAGSFFFAGVETGFVSWNPLKVRYRANQGEFSAKWATYLIKQRERVLSTVLIGNNISIVIVTLAFGYLFLQLDHIVPFNLTRIPSPETWILSPVLVIFTEMIPKSLYRIYSFRLTIKSIPILMVFYWTFLPFTWIFSLVGKFLGSNREKGKAYAANVRKEMVLLAQEGSRRGTLFEYARLFIDNILKLKDTTVSDIILERKKESMDTKDAIPESKGIHVNDSISDILDNDDPFLSDSLLIYTKSEKKPTGWISLLDIAKADKDMKVGEIMRPLIELDGEETLLHCISNKQRYKDPYYKITGKNSKKDTVLERYELLKVVFGGYNTH